MENPPIHEPVFLIEVSKISVNPFQPRKVFDEERLKELANSIREYGVLQPLVVTKVETETDTGTSVQYELIAGERRLRAAKLTGLERVPALIKNVGLDRERLEMAIVENVQRADLNPIESARAYSRLQDEFNLTQREIASRIGKSRESVANTMRLLNLPTNMQDSISAGQLGESQARLLLSVEDMHQQQLLYEETLRSGLSVRELKGKIDYIKSVKRDAVPGQEKQAKLGPLFDPEAETIKQRLEETLGTSVKVERKGDHGKITIEYYSPEELRTLLGKISKRESEENAQEPPVQPSAPPQFQQPEQVTPEPYQPQQPEQVTSEFQQPNQQPQQSTPESEAYSIPVNKKVAEINDPGDDPEYPLPRPYGPGTPPIIKELGDPPVDLPTAEPEDEPEFTI